MEKATLAGGCFWCTEAIFKRLRGVESVVSGYAGGHVNPPAGGPSYEQVTTGATGHAEAINIDFDPKVISYEKLIEIFFDLHDPTTLNRQGADEGTQYRSAIFYHDEAQKEIALKVRDQVEKSRKYHHPIITEIVPFEEFYTAEEYHQNYYDNNKTQGYCDYVISPKIKKLLAGYKKEVKEEFLTESH